jgi:alginate biosynthesis protein AlgX
MNLKVVLMSGVVAVLIASGVFYTIKQSEKPVEQPAPVQTAVEETPAPQEPQKTAQKPVKQLEDEKHEERPFPDFASCPKLRDEAAYGEEWEDYSFLVPGKDGFVFRTGQDLRSDFEIEDDVLPLWQKFVQLFKSRGIELVVAYIPTRGIIARDLLPENDSLFKDYDPAIARASYTGGIEKMNLAGVTVVGMADAKDAPGFFNKADQHWSQSGAKEMAETIATAVHNLPAWQSVPKKKFVTTSTRKGYFEGRFNRALEAMCNFKTPDEIDLGTETAAEGGGASESALFEDAAVPDIVLVGTSNSKKEDHDPNFEGHLKTALGADVYNAAVTGGGLDDSIVEYTTSDRFRKSPPKILVWEIPGYYDLSGEVMEKTLRQVMAGMHGFCATPIIQRDAPLKITDKEINAFEGLETKGIALADAYIALEFDLPVKKDFTVIMDSVEGKSEKYKFKRPRTEGGRDFFYAPRGRSAKTFKSISLKVNEKLIGSSVTKFQICPLP